jgi:hypothetical protein
MIAHFVNVLVPVHLHSKDEKAIEIAIHMADPRFCVIHLLDVVRPNIWSSVFGVRGADQEISGVGIHRLVNDMLYMNRLKQEIEECRPNSTVKIHVCKSSKIPEAIAWYANRLNVQVVVVPEIESKKDLSLEDIAGRTHCKILMYKDGILSVVEKSDPFVNDVPYGDVKQKVSDVGVDFSVN